jgi:predicted alpha/beta hydrolase family esterase
MKRAVILHGTSSHPSHNWQPWIKAQLEANGYQVWAPELPNNDVPNRHTYDDFLRNSGWDFTDNLLVGHSSGATTVLNLLSSDWLPHIKSAVVVGTFLNEDLTRQTDWHDVEMFKHLFPNDGFDMKKIHQNVDHIYFIHGDQDPLCSFDDARECCEELGGTFVAVAGAGHFSSPTTEIPEIITTLKQYNDL